MKHEEGDQPIDIISIEIPEHQISPREKTREKMIDLVERTHDSILINRERKKLQESISDTQREMNKIRRLLYS